MPAPSAQLAEEKKKDHPNLLQERFVHLFQPTVVDRSALPRTLSLVLTEL